MYIPTQDERYSKAARLTLLLCIVAPSGFVAWMMGAHWYNAAAAFLIPPMELLDSWGFNEMAAACISAIIQLAVFVWLNLSKRLSSKTKLTIAITWGMLFALILRVLIYHAAAQ